MYRKPTSQLTDILNKVTINDTIRTDCPYCGGRNTFTASSDGKFLLWNCYRASCKRSGARPIEAYSVGTLGRLVGGLHGGETNRPFTMPGSFVSVLQVNRALEYLRRNNCMDALLDGRADIMWDDDKERVVFLIKENGNVVDAVGRRVSSVPVANGRSPKWLRYGDSGGGITIQQAGHGMVSTSILVVEDAASACAASCISDSLGILGSSISSSHLSVIRSYGVAIIALDPDAKLKAIELHRKLSWYVDTKVWFIPDDLKYYNKEEIRKLAHDEGII